MFSETPTIHFRAEQEICPIDKEDLKVFKSTTKKVYSTIIGAFFAHHVELYCPEHHEEGPFKSKSLERIVAADCNFAYDAIVEIGKLRHLHHYQVEEIKETFKQKYNLPISNSGIETLLLKFITYLSIVHENSSELIKAYIKAQGGYILHLDTTCEGDSPKLASSIDALSGFVLHSARLRSENEQEIVLFLTSIKNMLGTPLATFSDMGPGILKAVKNVFGDCPHYICHFHFLKMIGKLLFEEENNQLRKKLSQAGISGALKNMKRELEKKFNQLNIKQLDTYLSNPEKIRDDKQSLEILVYNLILWILDYASEGNGYGFPYDRSYLSFYVRLKQAIENINNILPLFSYEAEQNNMLWKLRTLILKITDDKNLRPIVKLYKTKVKLFDKLRHALRSAPEDEHNGLADVSISKSKKELKLIQKAVAEFRTYIDREIVENKNNNLVNSYKLVTARIRKYNSMLFSDPLEVEVAGKKRMIFFHRTNNILERHFRALSYANRRISGKNSLRKNLENMHPATPLAMNLKNKNYVRLIFGDELNIATKFSEIDIEMVRQKITDNKNEKFSASRKMKKIIRDDDFLLKLYDSFKLHVNYAKVA